MPDAGRADEDALRAAEKAFRVELARLAHWCWRDGGDGDFPPRWSQSVPDRGEPWWREDCAVLAGVLAEAEKAGWTLAQEELGDTFATLRAVFGAIASSWVDLRALPRGDNRWGAVLDEFFNSAVLDLTTLASRRKPRFIRKEPTNEALHEELRTYLERLAARS